jgi:type VI secretion system protein ImpL
MSVSIITIAAFLVFFVVTTFVPSLFGLPTRDMWTLRVGLWILWALVLGAVIWRYLSRIRSGVPASNGSTARDLDFLIREARQKVSGSQLGRQAKFDKLPLLFIAGSAQCGKTTTVVNCGLDPELLAGLVHQGTRIVPTNAANFWLAGTTIVIEASGAIWSDSSCWTQFMEGFRPPSMAAAASTLGPRSILLCVSAEDLVQSGGLDALIASARLANDRINDLAHVLGIRLPVYVAFTKSNLLKYFNEYVLNFSGEEVREVLGATLPIVAPGPETVYMDFQTRRVNEAFNSLFYSLSERRPLLLDRENDPAKLPGIYQFPREFSKLRETLIPFLVALGRPKQTQVSLYLRGFYFVGVRPVEAVDATGQARRAPQWIFVPQLFREVLMGDRPALSTSVISQRTAVIRRTLLVVAAGLGLVITTGWTTSYLKNRTLGRRAFDAARAVGQSRGGSSLDCSLASTESLKKLETLRTVLGEMENHRKFRPPIAFRWGLYTGSEIYPHVRSAYFDAFRRILLNGTQEALVDYLNRLPAAPGVNDEYTGPYNALRAYLITTVHPEKSDRDILSPVLQQFWRGGCFVGEKSQDLAARQFEFYTEELKADDRFSRQNDGGTIDHARAYLNGLAGPERVYRAVLAEANKKARAIQFNRDYPGSDVVILNAKEIPGAFTKDGWGVVQKGMKNARSIFEGENWVLGPGAAQGIDFTGVEQQLLQRYSADYLAYWQVYLKQTLVRPYTAGLADAAKKLMLLSSSQSPLLAALYLASKHTVVEQDAIRASFQPVQTVVDPKSEDYNWIGANNGPYMKALLDLQVSVEQLSKVPESARDADPSALASQSAAAAAKRVVLALGQQFRPDPVGGTDQTVLKLLEAPITLVEPLIRNMNVAALNAKGAQLCGQIRSLWGKYPFNLSGPKQPISDFIAFFQRPGGVLWQFYVANLSSLLREENGGFRAVPTPTMSARSAFVKWFNDMVAISRYLFVGNKLQFAFNVQQHEGDGLKTVKLMVGGQGGPITRTAQQFLWPSDPDRGVEWTLEDNPNPQQYAGVWGVFEWFSSATWQPRSPTGYSVTWPLTLGGRPRQGRDGQPVNARLYVDMPIPLFQNGYLRRLGCVAEVAQAAN